MKKTTILFLLLFTNFIYSQVDYTNVLNLLINNKREEARILFDKQFGKSKTTNIDLLFLDAFIDEESGKLSFDETLIKNLEKLPNSQYYIAPFINRDIVLSDISTDACNDFTYKKIDYLSSSPKFKDLPIIKYRKAVFERKRMQFEEAKKSFAAMETINDWQFCGVFENLNGSGLDIEYEPELYAKNDKLFDANSNGRIGWYNPKNVEDDAYQFFINESEYGNGIIYAQTFIDSPEKKSFLLNFGASQGLKIFLNDKEIYYNQDIKKTNLDAYTLKIDLEKGINRLLFKLSTSGGSDYFSAQVKNLDATFPIDLKYYKTFQPYTVSKTESIQAEILKLDYEQYFDDLVKKYPDNLLCKLFQFTAYESNNKTINAYEAIEGLDNKYPNSSFIASYFLRYYDLVGDEEQKKQEIIKNIEKNDINYYYATFSKILDGKWLENSSIADLEVYRDRSKKYKQRFCELMFDFMIASKKEDVAEMFKLLDDIDKDTFGNEKFKIASANLYFKLKNDKAKTISLLEDISKDKIINEVDNLLINYYNELNDKAAVEKIVKRRIKEYAYINVFRDDYIRILANENQYEQALAVVDENLSNFPYSFTNMEKKAAIYNLMKNNKEAEKYIRQSLTYNSGNGKLRKQLYDISKTPDEIDEIATKDIYKLIKSRRNSKLKGDYGVVLLLDEYLVNVFPEGGRKSRISYIYEITSESGIEKMKEYSINLDRNTILKSEIIKIDGTIVPAEVGDDVLVFANLKVGDVIYMEYERIENGTGRFYKDFNLSCYFDSDYPSTEAIFGLVSPVDCQYVTSFSNGNVVPETRKINGKNCSIWKRSTIPALALKEDYAPTPGDLTNAIEVGTIKSWADIANWYSDLVKKNLKLDKITKDTFNSIFPKGVAGLSDEEKAKKIYTYIEQNITYSSLDFRQSGYVPQKPSKTISTKLGDCKDVSTLFVALSEYAGLKSNLVLVSTNDNGFNSMRLPSLDFNHCIVQTRIDNKLVFLELTDKYLPYRMLPTSLYKANALVISFDKKENEANKLINIPFDDAIQNILKTTSVVTLDDKSKIFVNTHTIEGATKSYYNELFSDATTADVREKEIEKGYNKQLQKVISLQSVKLLSNEIFDKGLIYETTFSINENLQKVGGLKITDIPFIDKVYTRDIISTENRKFDINYFDYEANNRYESEVILNIPEDKKFSEIPESKTFLFKSQSYTLNFELIKNNSLKIKRDVTIPWDNIAPKDYLEYKKFVEEVIAAEEQIIGFK
ncbi:transglutaminase domain-containing protein [Flavobacterium sp. N3904]|uniref:transglutaminase domain-containing protein n=1 Tax=Flavobacterium sp. N3904 TaxID=2986835 RepID=UPI0022258D91|nr:transglutaminase domain-containing protein [Flavobacterium sp. N3904]